MRQSPPEDLVSRLGLQECIARVNVRRANASDTPSDEFEKALETLFRPSHRLAVYGSLAPGQANQHVLADLGGSWTSGFVEGELFAIGWGAAIGFPAMRWAPDGERIPVHLLVSARLPDAWTRLDRFEGPDYRRILIPIFGEEGLLAVANIYEARHRQPA